MATTKLFKPSAFAKILKGILAYDGRKAPIVQKMAVQPPKDPDGQVRGEVGKGGKGGGRGWDWARRSW